MLCPCCFLLLSPPLVAVHGRLPSHGWGGGCPAARGSGANTTVGNAGSFHGPRPKVGSSSSVGRGYHGDDAGGCTITVPHVRPLRCCLFCGCVWGPGRGAGRGASPPSALRGPFFAHCSFTCSQRRWAWRASPPRHLHAFASYASTRTAIHSNNLQQRHPEMP